MFTATWPDSVVQLANELTKKRVRIDIGQHRGDENTTSLNANKSVRQIIEVVPKSEKKSRLFEVLSQHDHTRGGEPKHKALIFLNTKNGCSSLCQELIANGVKADCLHGNRPQAERESVMNDFTRGNVKVMTHDLTKT